MEEGATRWNIFGVLAKHLKSLRNIFTFIHAMEGHMGKTLVAINLDLEC